MGLVAMPATFGSMSLHAVLKLNSLELIHDAGGEDSGISASDARLSFSPTTLTTCSHARLPLGQRLLPSASLSYHAVVLTPAGFLGL